MKHIYKGYVLTVVAEQESDWPFLPRYNSYATWVLGVPYTKKMLCSSGISYIITKLLHAMPEHFSQQSVFNPQNESPCSFTTFRRKQALLPVSICCRNSCAVTLSWGCRMGLYSCLAFELFCFKQEHLLIRVKHSLMPCTKLEDIFWTKATKSRSSCMHRPQSWPILVPKPVQSKRKRKDIENKVSSQLVHFSH